jgi:hypothetical protein
MARMYGDPNVMRVLYKRSEVVERKDKVQEYYPVQNEFDGSGGVSD